ncbi:MAG: peptidylprolyl isomerase [Nitrospirota bacterium]
MKKVISVVVFAVSMFAIPLQAQEQNKEARLVESCLVEACLVTVALVNDVPIYEAKLLAALKPYKDEMAGSKTVELKMREKVLNQLIEEELVMQEAVAKKVVVTSGEIEQIIGLIRSRFENEEKFNLSLKMAGIDAAEFQKKVEEKLMRVRIADWGVKSKIQLSQEGLDNFCKDYGIKVNAQHILVNTEKEAVDIFQQALAGVNFTTLAATYSLCPSKQVGGNLGFFGRGQMVTEFENAAFAMNKEDELSGVVKTKFGYHLIRFIAKKEPTPDEVNEIKQALINELYGRTYLVIGEGLDFEIKRNLEEKFIGKQLQQGYIDWLCELKNKAKIKIVP